MMMIIIIRSAFKEFITYRNRFCNTIHHLLEYRGGAYKDIVFIVNTWPTDNDDDTFESATHIFE